mmetsp:Transcript_24386/g.49396  ORF Transcript_24386/g.49396 Transcript_24386/m.49396 type:complete len:94 (+) Transcript_24386:435-716(+)
MACIARPAIPPTTNDSAKQVEVIKSTVLREMDKVMELMESGAEDGSPLIADLGEAITMVPKRTWARQESILKESQLAIMLQRGEGTIALVEDA